MEREYDGENIEDLKKLLLYHKVVDAKVISDYCGELILDNGMTLEVIPNMGCGGCGNGWYYLSDLAKCENVITDVSIEYSQNDDYDEVIRVFVFTEDERIKIIDVYGDEGNGYYGRGFNIYVNM